MDILFLDVIRNPWPWYVSGPLIGLTVPVLAIYGNKAFGLSSSLKHICAACLPARLPFFDYNWKQESWNLVFVFGIFVGGIVASTILANPNPMNIDPKLILELNEYGIHVQDGLMPRDLFSWNSLSSLKGWVLMVFGGFLIGFGSRYANGCNSGHAIYGLSTLQWPSLVATICFMIGGFLMANFGLPLILNL
jgi:uncharacterized protein